MTPATVAELAELDPKTVAAQADMCVEVLPDVVAILAAAHLGDLAAVVGRADLLRSFLTARLDAIRTAHPTEETHL